MFFPSADHPGCSPTPLITRRRYEPSAFMTQIVRGVLAGAPRLLSYAIRFPSGDQAGRMSYGPWLSCRSCEPSAFITHSTLDSPEKPTPAVELKTILLPSGDQVGYSSMSQLGVSSFAEPCVSRCRPLPSVRMT